MAQEQVLVVFAYAERKQTRNQENLRFFLQEGLQRFQPHHARVRTILVLNGPPALSLKLPTESATFHVVRRPENTGFDMSCYLMGLEVETQRLGLKSVEELPYGCYVFLNCSQRGPFLPAYWVEEQDHWCTAFEHKLKTHGLVGSSMWWDGQTLAPIVETWAFALTKHTLALVQAKQVFHNVVTKSHATDAERRLSHVVQTAGYTVGCFLSKFQPGVIQTSLLDKNFYCIPSRPLQYEGVSIHPFETMFYKTFWASAGPQNDGYECPFEQRYTQWKFQETESRPVVSMCSLYPALPPHESWNPTPSIHYPEPTVWTTVVTSTVIALAGLILFGWWLRVLCNRPDQRSSSVTH